MTTSGTYTWQPSLGETTVYAFNLIGIRPASLLAEHLDSARMAANMMLASFSNNGTNLWAVTKVTTPLVAGTATYSVDPNVVVMLDAYIQYGSPAIDRIIMPVSRSEYASYAQKSQQGAPTVFWNDRLLSPTVTLWPTPDGNQANLVYYAIMRLQDANMNGTETLDVPQIWLEAFAFGLAVRLALIWAQDKVALLKPFADQAYQAAVDTNVETAQQYVIPLVGNYYR